MRTSLTLAFALASSPVGAAVNCSAYVGQRVQLISPASAVLKYKGVPEKSEYETTEQYATRVASAAGNSTLVISKKAQNGLYLEYDADAGKLIVFRGMFGPQLDAWSTFIGAGHWDLLRPDVVNNVGAVLDDRETQTGSYTGQNAFGATSRVKRIRRVRAAVYDQPGTWFPSAIGSNPNAVGEIPMPPTRAKTLKPVLRVALVIRPRPPYLVRGSRVAETASLDHPREVRESYEVLIGDIDCGLLVQPDGTVLASYRAGSD